MSYSFGLEPGWGRLGKADDYVLLRAERIVNLLLSLGREECDSILAEQGRIAITCEFCGKEYVFDRNETAELFVAALSVSSNTRH